ncbi:MAG: hypothetical protein HYR85_02785 [Planctomycetes bacterium]|nr:hypothetical protein [Planctomycetota bacterium]MBI3848428.1 hypothetical protein [Planctomycetota bacterium]
MSECKTKRGEREREFLAQLQRVSNRCVFGPSFFVEHLAGFVRDRCPDPAESLPTVEIHLTSGAVLEICHVIGLGPRWVALAVVDGTVSQLPLPMRTELVPYETILRVTIRPIEPREGSIGFRLEESSCAVLSPEEALRRVSEPFAGETPNGHPTAKGK